VEKKVESLKESPGYPSNAKREKFHTKNKEKENDIGLEEPRRFINSKKQASNEDQNANKELKTDESRRQTESATTSNQNQNYGTEHKK